VNAKAESENMKIKCFISIAAFIMLSCMASSPQQSLQSQLFGTWAASGDEVAVFQINKDSCIEISE
jgi:putative lipoprotein